MRLLALPILALLLVPASADRTAPPPPLPGAGAAPPPAPRRHGLLRPCDGKGVRRRPAAVRHDQPQRRRPARRGADLLPPERACARQPGRLEDARRAHARLPPHAELPERAAHPGLGADERPAADLSGAPLRR